MVQVDYIRDQYQREGKSLRRIAREMGLSFRTVQKYANMEDFSEEARVKRSKVTYPVLGPHLATIDSWLEQDQREPRKQRHSIRRIQKRLKDEYGVAVSYGAVWNYVSKKRKEYQNEREGYLPLTQPLGHAQVDFGHFKYYTKSGEAKNGCYLVLTLPYSNAGWIQAFQAENQECLLEGLQRIFRHIGGVPIRIRMDNMSTAVAQIKKGQERDLTDGFLRFKLHHRFEAEFCNPASGNEKGNVENKVGYSRRNLLVPVPIIEDFDTYNEELLARCDADHERTHYRHGVRVQELLDEEKAKLLEMPKYPFEAFRYESLRVSKTGFVTIDTNRYGLPPQLAGKIVEAKIYYNRIELYEDHQFLRSYPRSYEKREEVSDWKAYLTVLLAKPGALEHTRFFGQMPKLWQTYLRSIHGERRKTALRLLEEMVHNGHEEQCDEALELAQSTLGGRVDNDSIRQCYLYITRPEKYPQPLQLASNPPRVNYNPDLSAYDRLLTMKSTALSGGGDMQ